MHYTYLISTDITTNHELIIQWNIIDYYELLTKLFLSNIIVTDIEHFHNILK